MHLCQIKSKQIKTKKVNVRQKVDQGAAARDQ